MRRRLPFAIAATVGLAASPLALAQGAAYRSKPIRLIVRCTPGGRLDIGARTLAERIEDSLGAVLVENRPAAGGALARAVRCPGQGRSGRVREVVKFSGATVD